MNLEIRRRSRAMLVTALLAASFTSASATWSIIAVDPETREVGVAAASCSYMVQGIEGVVPGVGILVVQAASNADARARGVELMGRGAGPSEILQAMRSPEFQPGEQQYALIVFGEDAKPRVFTGGENAGWSGAQVGDGFSVQGNTLTDEGVVKRTATAYQGALKQAGLTMADRLVKAITAGGASGGDARCGDQRARTAFVKVVRADDPAPVPYLNLVVFGLEEGDANAVERLNEEYGRWKASGTGSHSTQLFLVP